MSFLPGAFPAIAAGKRLPFLLEGTDNASSTSDDTSYSFFTVAFGAVPPSGEKRYIAVATGGAAGSNRTINSVTIGGVSAVEVIGRDATPAPCGIWIAEVPTGTSGTVSVVFGGEVKFCAIGVWRIMNPEDPLGEDTAAGEASTGGTIDLSLNIPYGGLAVGICASENQGIAGLSWTGLVEFFDAGLDGNDDRIGMAEGGSPGTPFAISAVNPDTVTSAFDAVAASWGPNSLIY